MHHIRLTTHLAIFHVELGATGGLIDRSLVPLSTASALKSCFHANNFTRVLPAVTPNEHLDSYKSSHRRKTIETDGARFSPPLFGEPSRDFRLPKEAKVPRLRIKVFLDVPWWFQSEGDLCSHVAG